MVNHHFAPPFGRICLELVPRSWPSKSKINGGYVETLKTGHFSTSTTARKNHYTKKKLKEIMSFEQRNSAENNKKPLLL